MKPEELRIGNFIRSEIANQDMTICEVHQGNVMFHPLFKKVDSSQKPFMSLMVYLKPIPLTEEWLEKFGLEPVIGNEWGDDLLCFEWADEELIYTAGEGLALSPWIKYVHQLQNLYFALTGKELELI